jgi:hypothetical protein
MEEARAVLERLDRIERASGRDELLTELRELIREVERWTAAETATVATRPERSSRLPPSQ